VPPTHPEGQMQTISEADMQQLISSHYGSSSRIILSYSSNRSDTYASYFQQRELILY
jgi:hypothetical protein